MDSALARLTALGQGVFYALTGLWAIVHLPSFEAVTGPKTDDWLVKTVGVLVTVIGGVLVLAARRRRITAEVALLAAGSALGLAAIDLIYALSGVISPIYLLDAAVELGLAGLWGFVRARA
jgi:energy-converting hydrogenase Eha subunit E